MLSNVPSGGSKWDDMLSCLLQNEQLLLKKIQFDPEFSFVELIYKIKSIQELLPNWIYSLGRSTNKSTIATNDYRTKGNELYQHVYSHGAEAIECYTKAIFTAPKNSKELGLAHANRAAALIALDYYEEAYNDCEMAKVHSYPKENLIKVLLRQATSSVFLKNSKYLQKSIAEIEKYLSENISISHKTAKIFEFKLELKKLEENRQQKLPDNFDNFKNKSTKQKSSILSGRYVVADENLKENEAIIKENAFAFVPVYGQLNDDCYIDYNCQNCGQTNIIPFPCYDCFRASYCCPSCRLQHEHIHHYECEGYKRNLWFEIGIAHLSIRTMLTGIVDLIAKMEQCNVTNVFNILTEDEPELKYLKIVNLVHNLDKMEHEDMLRYTLTSVLLTIYLKYYTKFFNDISTKVTKFSIAQLETLVLTMITMHMGQLVCNGHAISDLSLTLPTKMNCLHSKDLVRLGMLHCYISSERIFTAIYPQISILNHSCDPNIRNIFEKKTLTIYTTKDIGRNEEIFNCYGPNYKLLHRDERQAALKQQYCFDCTCSKCVEYDDTVKMFQTYLCQNSTCKSSLVLKYSKNWWRSDECALRCSCRKCGHKQNFEWNTVFTKLINHLKYNEVFGDICNQACDIYITASKFMCDFHEHKMDMAYVLLSNSVLMSGNDTKHNLSNKLLKIAKDYLKGCEIRFGKSSLEFVVASAFLLDLLAIKKKLIENSGPEYDLDDIIASVDILSSSSKILFTNYIKNYIL